MTGPAASADPSGGRSSRLLGPSMAGRGVVASIASTILVFGVIGWLVMSSPNWEQFRQAFLDPEIFAASLPRILHAFWINVQLFLVCEVLILGLGLVIAVMRSLSGPAFFPFRLIAVIYADFFRGVPGIVVIYVLGFGLPSLGIEGLPIDEFFWAVIALTLIYSAYVSEVYRAGIDSVHPSQEAAARSLGLSRAQAMRHVVLPQAVRRVIPPLLNDFIGLQKDTALVAFIGVVEAFSRSQIISAGEFNLTPYLATALIFLVLTIPMARFVDWLIARDRRRTLASAR